MTCIYAFDSGAHPFVLMRFVIILRFSMTSVAVLRFFASVTPVAALSVFAPITIESFVVLAGEMFAITTARMFAVVAFKRAAVIIAMMLAFGVLLGPFSELGSFQGSGYGRVVINDGSIVVGHLIRDRLGRIRNRCWDPGGAEPTSTLTLTLRLGFPATGRFGSRLSTAKEKHISERIEGADIIKGGRLGGR